MEDAPTSKQPRCDEAEYKHHIVLLKTEMKKAKPKSKVIKQLMDETMDERRQWIDNDGPTAEDIVIMYPSLRVLKWVCKSLCNSAMSEFKVPPY